MRKQTVLALGFTAVAFSACKCQPEDLNKPVCKFTVSPHDARPDDPAGAQTGPLAFGEVQKGSERIRPITINNGDSNVPLTALSLVFSDANRDSYSVRGEVPTVAANASASVSIVFSPIPIDGDIGNTLTVSHPAIDGVACPTFTVTLRGRALPPTPPDGGTLDASVADAAVDAGSDGGTDAGPIHPRPDAGQPLGDAGHFEARGGLQTARTEFGAALLQSGEILVVGGFDTAGQATATTEFFNPHTGLSRLGPPMTDARARHSVSVLADGRVVVFGGVDSGAVNVAQVVTSLEVFTPATQQWTRVVTQEKRAGHVAVSLGTQVLLAYGYTQGAAGTPLTLAQGAVLVDATGAIAPVTGDASALVGRAGPAVADLDDGTALFLGGANAAGAPLADVVRYSAGTLTAVAAALGTARAYASAAHFKDGPVVVTGGVGAAGPLLTAEQLDVLPNQAMWAFAPVASPVAARLMAQGLRVADDVLLFLGGVPSLPTDGNVLALQDAQLFVHVASVGVLVAGTINDLSIPRVNGEAVVFDGGVAILGGSATLPRRSSRPDVDRFFPVLNRFETAGLLGPGGAVTGAAPRQLFVAGGVDLSTGRPTQRTRVMNLETNAFSESLPLLVARTDATATLLEDGTIMVVGGTSPNGDPLSHVERVQGGLTSSMAAAPLTTARRHHSATVLQDGRVLVCGGIGGGANALDTCEIYNPATNAWASPSGRHMVKGRYDHTATLLDSGNVLLTGGNDPALNAFRGDVFDPLTNTLHATLGTPVLARRGHIAVLVGVGRVLLAGGETYVGERVPTDTAEIWTESTESYDNLMPGLSTPRDGAAGLLFSNGLTLVTGGGQAVTSDPDFPSRALSRTEVYDPAMGPLGAFRNIDMALRTPRARALGVDILGQPTVIFGEGRHGIVGAGLEARIPLTTVELWVP